MNYFGLFDLAPRFDLDLAALEKRYFEQQRALHPDRLPANEKSAAIQKSADINDAYRTLKSPLKRAQHLLALEGIRVNTESDTMKPGETLLTEIMELRERLVVGEGDALRLEVKHHEKETLQQLQSAFEAQDYQQAAHHTLRLNYLTKLLQDMA